MGALESQEEGAPKRFLWYQPLGFLGVISGAATLVLWIQNFTLIMSAPVLPIPEPKRLTIGQSSNSLTYFAQHIG